MKNIPFKNIRLLSITVLIVVGICIIVSPWVNAWLFDNMQKQLMRLWQNSAKSGGIAMQNDSPRAPSWSRSTAVIGDADTGGDIWEEDINPKVDMQYVASMMEGIITIEKIRLHVPILKQYTINNLNISVCSVIPTNHMGEAGNYVLAGHYSQIYGRHFNRLAEVVPGDFIVVENETQKYTYQVSDVFTVMPSEVWVMENDGDKKLITLITCDYRTNPIGRLIVRGELLEDGA